MILKSVGVLSAGKIMGLLYAVLGLIGGFFFAFFSVIGALAEAGNEPTSIPVIIGIGVAATIMIPLFYGIIGFVGGIIMAAVYNLVAGFVGGIELELDHPAGTINTLS